METTQIHLSVPGWLWLNLAAMGFSLMHSLTDFVLAMGSSTAPVMQRALLILLIALLYTWWGWIFARAVGGVKSGFVGLIAFAILWVTIGNGLTIMVCMPPCGSLPLYADTLHLGTLILGPLAAFFTFRAISRISAPVKWLAAAGNILIMLAFLIGIFALIASLMNPG